MPGFTTRDQIKGVDNTRPDIEAPNVGGLTLPDLTVTDIPD